MGEEIAFCLVGDFVMWKMLKSLWKFRKKYQKISKRDCSNLRFYCKIMVTYNYPFLIYKVLSDVKK